MAKILVVEDEELISELIQEFLLEKGHVIQTAFDGETAISLFNNYTYDLIILDILLPKKSGLEVLREIRDVSRIPIIMLTALDDEQTQLISFNQDINDYVTKPFSPSILVKRVENVLKMFNSNEKNIFKISGINICLDTCEITQNDQLIRLTKKEFDIIACLIKNLNHTVTREQLINYVWSYDSFVDTRILDNHIRNIRKKIKGIPITTITGIGYKLEDN